MSTIVGVDLSLSATGLVTWRDGRIYVTTITTPARTPPPARHDTIVNRLLRMADPTGPTLYVLEGRITPGEDAVQTAMDLAELRGVVNYGIYARGHDRVDVHPSTLKLYATGNGGSSKASMVAAARGRLGNHLHVTNDNEADAAWLMAMAMHRLGRPLCPMPAKNRAAVARPAWPEFTLEAA